MIKLRAGNKLLTTGAREHLIDAGTIFLRQARVLHAQPLQAFALIGKRLLNPRQAINRRFYLRQALVQWQQEHDDRIARPDVLEALTDMHDRTRQSHYPDGFGKMPRDRNIVWHYDQWLDPGIPA